MKKIIITIFLLSLCLTQSVHAQTSNAVIVTPTPSPRGVEGSNGCPQGEYCLLEPLPVIEGVENVKGCVDGNMLNCINFNTFIEYVFKFAIAIAVLLATFMIIIGGFQWMFSETPFKIGDAKKRISNAIYGLLAALISYLVLQTIDPRLVQISTQIEPICNAKNQVSGGACDPNALENFNKKYYEDLRGLVADKRVKVYELDQQKKILEAKAADLKGQLDRNEISPYDYEVKTFGLKDQIAAVNLQIEKESIQGMGYIQWAQAFQAITEPVGDGAKKYIADETPGTWGADGKLRTDYPNEIQNAYNRRINALDAIEPKTQETINTIRQLDHQKSFFIAQAKEEYELKNKLAENKALFGATNPTVVQGDGAGGTMVVKVENTSRKWLEAKLKEYETKASTAPPQEFINNTGLPADQYNAIYQKRVEQVKQELARTPPKQ